MGLIDQLQGGLAAQSSKSVDGNWRLAFKRLKAQACSPDNPINFELLRARWPQQRQSTWLHRLDAGVGSQPHIPALQGLLSLLPVEGLGLGQQSGALLNQVHDRAPLQLVGQLAGQFHPAGTSSHHGQTLQGPGPLLQSLD